MERILKIKECMSNFDDTKIINLCVVNENNEDLQGRITVEKINKVEFEPLKTNERCEDAPRYFVYNPTHEGKPQKIYMDYNEALKDAKDIASKYDLCNVYVLQIVAEIEKKNFVHKRIKESGKAAEINSWENIPF